MRVLYDLDNSRIVGLEAPQWKDKEQADRFSMAVSIYKVLG